MLAPHLPGVGLKERHVFGHRSREGMMAGIPAILLLIEAEQGEIDHPKEIESSRVEGQFALSFQHVCAVKAYFAEDLAGIEPLIGREQDQVAFLNGQLASQSLFLNWSEELDNG